MQAGNSCVAPVRLEVPGPLTAESEVKKLEKKKAQKSQKKRKEKEQKDEKRKQELEAEEKKKFASLTDREKVCNVLLKPCSLFLVKAFFFLHY